MIKLILKTTAVVFAISAVIPTVSALARIDGNAGQELSAKKDKPVSPSNARKQKPVDPIN